MCPGNVGKIFSLGERTEVTREEPRKLLGTESPSLSIQPSRGRPRSRCPRSFTTAGAGMRAAFGGRKLLQTSGIKAEMNRA